MSGDVEVVRRRAQAAGVLLTVVSPLRVLFPYGGDTLNFAVYLARLTRSRDVRVDYVTALGDDPYSDAMLAMWQGEGIGCELVARLPGRLPGFLGFALRLPSRSMRSILA